MKTSLHLLILLLTLSMLGFAQPKSKLVGTIEHFENFQSKYVRPRNVDVWLPADYNKKEKYAVIYFQDGKMLFESVRAGKFEGFEWQVDETLTELVKQNKIRKTIVVAIWNTGEFRHSEYYPQKSLELLKSPRREKIVKELLADKPQADNYLLFMTKELKPYIDKKYSTAKDQKNTFLAGSSMGGLISLYAISEYESVWRRGLSLDAFDGCDNAGRYFGRIGS